MGQALNKYLPQAGNTRVTGPIDSTLKVSYHAFGGLRHLGSAAFQIHAPRDQQRWSASPRAPYV